MVVQLVENATEVRKEGGVVLETGVLNSIKYVIIILVYSKVFEIILRTTSLLNQR